MGGAALAKLESDIKAAVKKIIQGNEKRKRRIANNTAGPFDRLAVTAIEDALNNSCENITGQAKEEMQRQIYKSILYNVPYENLYGIPCGRRQFYDYRTEFIIKTAEGLGMMPHGSSTRGA